ncbi:outer membrane insertion signal domain protein [Lactobacillus ultunensis DSM 16047]|uniref:Outer membrane insertion signal domain protein n=1 Tax=Lactobacillus ultunensis DSM 16047 TaxID=525365 RepID=C2EKU0_9LACO|nr:outer membrane insertion signal domain protein [Lactobacillus ultunensis DSM 16047]
MYLEKSLSYYASISYKFAKGMRSDNLVNEIIAETYTSQQPHDQILYELTRKLINYGKRN